MINRELIKENDALQRTKGPISLEKVERLIKENEKLNILVNQISKELDSLRSGAGPNEELEHKLHFLMNENEKLNRLLHEHPHHPHFEGGMKPKVHEHVRSHAPEEKLEGEEFETITSGQPKVNLTLQGGLKGPQKVVSSGIDTEPVQTSLPGHTSDRKGHPPHPIGHKGHPGPEGPLDIELKHLRGRVGDLEKENAHLRNEADLWKAKAGGDPALEAKLKEIENAIKQADDLKQKAFRLQDLEFRFNELKNENGKLNNQLGDRAKELDKIIKENAELRQRLAHPGQVSGPVGVSVGDRDKMKGMTWSRVCFKLSISPSLSWRITTRPSRS